MKVLIFGLGSYSTGSGSTAALYYAKRGVPVRITDQKTAAELNPAILKKLRSYPNVQFILGKHRLMDVQWADLIVRNPGVPDNSYIQQAHRLKKPITNDVGIFLQLLREQFSRAQVPVIAITGTRGKSTTTSLIAHVLRQQLGDKKVHLGGNIGYSPLQFLKSIRSGDIVVLELSSWLLRDLHDPAFTVAVVTNLLRDHMNYYRSMMLYQRDKERIFLGQTSNDVAVINALDPTVRRMAKKTKAQVMPFRRKRISGGQLLGEHNQFNLGAAWAVGKLFGVSDQTLQQAVRSFTGLPNRLELVRTCKERQFYNDTTATTPDATIAALLSFKKKVILIAGGNSKQIPLKALVQLIPRKVKQLILLPGNATAQFPKGLYVSTISQAVRAAWELSQPGDIILLSPGVTWLPVMNEFERGKQFVQAVRRIK